MSRSTKPSSDEQTLPPALLTVNDIPRGKYDFLMKQAREIAPRDPEKARAIAAYAYTRPDGFWHFCKDICGTDILDETFHKAMLPYITGYIDNSGICEPYRMVMAFRGSLKSTIASVGYIAWRFARDVIESGGASTLSVGLASERQQLAKLHIRAIKNILASPQFTHYFGTHRPTGAAKNWGASEFTSALRPEGGGATYKNPSAFIISLGAEQTGYHCDLIVADDLQAYQSSFSPDQLEKCWELYVLLHAILNPGGEMLIVGTRWSFSDIYQRIMDRASKAQDKTGHFRSIVLPIVDAENRPTFPSRFPEPIVKNLLAKSTTFSWASQYLLNPIADESRKFQLSDLRYVDGDIDRYLRGRNSFAIMGFDPNWVSEERIRSGEADSKAYTVIVRFVVDPSGTIYMTHCYRGRPDKEEMCKELWNQWSSTIGGQTLSVGCQQVDYKYLKETFDSYALRTGTYPNFEWASSSQSEGKKQDRIEGALEGRVRSHKVYLLRGLEWLENEFYQFPYSKTFDGLDAISNAVKVQKVPLDLGRPTDTRTETDRHIDELHARTPRRRSWKAAY